MAAPTRPNNNKPFMARLLPGPRRYVGFNALVFNYRSYVASRISFGVNKAAYAVSEMFGWAGTLDARPNDARAFYATIAVTTLLGAALSLVGLDPVRALYWAAVVNGVLAAPLMAVMMLIVRSPRVMGRLTLPRSMAIWGWAATAVMATASLAFFILQ